MPLKTKEAGVKRGMVTRPENRRAMLLVLEPIGDPIILGVAVGVYDVIFPPCGDMHPPTEATLGQLYRKVVVFQVTKIEVLVVLVLADAGRLVVHNTRFLLGREAGNPKQDYSCSNDRSCQPQ